MNSGDRLDLLLRTELRRADELRVEDRYDAVLARSRQRTRRRWVVMAVAAAAVVSAVVGVGLQMPSSRTPHPAADPRAPLVGSWSRSVASSDVGEGTWTLSFEKEPVLALDGPPDRPATSVTDGASYQVDGDRVLVNVFVNGACGDVDPVGVYRWTVGSGSLRLSVVEDRCELREVLLTGTWTKSP